MKRKCKNPQLPMVLLLPLNLYMKKIKIRKAFISLGEKK